MKSLLKTLIFVIYIISFKHANAQNYHLNIYAKDSLDTIILNKIPFKKNHPTKQSALAEIKNISKLLVYSGYFNNTYIIKVKDSVINCRYTLNKKMDYIKVYYNAEFKKSSLNNINDIKFENDYFIVATNKIEDTLNTIISFYEKNGFSFTSIYLNNIKEDKDILTADLIIEQSKKRQITNIIVKGYPNFPTKYLNHFVKIKKNQIFNKETLNLISNRLNELPFITQIKNPAVLFNKDSTSLFLYLKKKSYNNFDGILGFTNNPTTNKIQFNGYLDLNLNNIFNNGESFKLNWKSFQKSNKSLKVQFKAPYIFNTSITPNFEFSIYQQDSTYLNSKTAIRLLYESNHNSNYAIIYNSEKSNLTQSIADNNFKDFTSYYYGVSYTYFKRATFNTFIPNKFLFESEFLFGKRKTTEKENQTKAKIKAAYLLNINSKNSFLFKSENAILNSNNYYQNELYRIGGTNSIRGFDEQSIFTSKYSISTMEYHYHINSSNELYTITDFGLIIDSASNSKKLYSLGVGILFKSNKNTINMSYAIGKYDRNPFNFKDSKFHLKLTYPF